MLSEAKRSQQQRTRIGLWAVSLLTALVEVVNLLSAVTASILEP